MPAAPVARLRTLLLTGVCLAGCDQAPHAVGSQPGTAVPEVASLSPRQQTLLYDWLFCHECTDGERDSARVAINDATVFDRLLTRVPTAWTDNMRLRLERIAADLALDSAEGLIYRNHYLANLHAGVQSRSAQLLGDMGTPLALDALWRAVDSAAQRTYRSDVITTVTASLLSAARRTSPASVPDAALQDLGVDSLPGVLLGWLSTSTGPARQAQYFRIASPRGSTIDARVEWTSAAAIELVWADCGKGRDFSSEPPLRVIRPRAPHSIRDSVTIPAGGCRILGLVKTDTVTPATVYRLRLGVTR